MRKIYLIGLFILSVTVLAAQNIVLNPGIDGYITCPGFGQFSSTYIISWSKPSIASSDYYNFNCAGIQPTVQAPHSGEGYAGIICYNYGTEYREYITGTFSSPMVAGTTYNVEFWVSLHNGYIQAIEEVGAYISASAPGPFSNSLHINVVPQIENNSGALNDTANWKRVYGQYQAAGGEQYITIGNFYDDAGTTITQPGTSGSYGSYYFIDDVSVVADSTTSLPDYEANAAPMIFVVAPGQLKIQAAPCWKQPLVIKCISIDGKLTDEIKTEHQEFLWEPNQIKNGLYFISITDATGKQKVQKIMVLR